ncbi:hypothetical protein C162_26695 [Paenibacillus sp. FSL R7-269]|uniref:hypothetical protein n=1 Tax=Paenibacillus sp. FSL R7-269 TaxID=1226755 RepID=UPI0003E2A828|nr:hypothetical protein [Paenibacillus sp. FSL R7-269]ETT40915.1 hypothetical protein C162_26695 [Paenibacillus sp. FSL R7-269]
MADKIIVMEKDGVSYAKLSSYSGFGSSYVINGEAAVPAPGDKNYAIVDGTVTSIEVKRTAPGYRVGYALYDRYKEITQLPHELPADAFTRDDDGDLCGENAEFYRAVHSEPTTYLEAVEFEIIDRNCEPVTIPSYVTIEFPNNIARYRETQHKYPCFISGKNVFDLLWERIKERVDNSDGKYVMDSYKNIQTLTVSERIAIPYHETTTRSYYPTARSRKPRIETVPVRWKSVAVIEVYGPEYSRKPTGRDATSAVRGKDYAELQTNLEAYISSFLSRMEDGKREVCRHCRGEGIVDVGGGVA